MKILLDFLPIIIFFVAFKFGDIYLATGAAIAATLIQVIWQKATKRPVEPMQWASLVIIVFFGGATLLFKNEAFIKWKPTILYWLFAAVLAGTYLIREKNLIKSLMGKQMEMPAPVWTRVMWMWVSFFAFMGALNLWVAYTYATETWVNFKLFGSMGLTFAFVIAQGIYIGRYVKEVADK
jgi:intracellular septation protein